MQVRIKEINGKFYPQRFIKGWLGGWTNKWPSEFIHDEWCGDILVYELNSLSEAKEFLKNREAKIYDINGEQIDGN